jgi:hypothetical protein
MTNLERWQMATSALISPQSFIDYSWYFTVGTFLSRRVWMGDIERSFFPNLFIICVGPAGIGKSLAVEEARRLILSVRDEAAPEVRLPNGLKEKPPLIKTCANSTNFSSIIEEMSRSIKHSKITVNGKPRPYAFTHFSFVEDELSALWRKQEGGEIVKMLLKLYDCKDYTYQTRMHQQEKIVNPYSSLLCSTTPSFLAEAHGSGIFDDGFSSRCCWLFEGKARRYVARLELYNQQQLEQMDVLRNRLRQLAKLSGQVIEPPDVREFVDKNYHEKIVPGLETSAGPMRDYYARKQAHIHKLAMCIHFSDSDSMELTIPDYELAIKMFDAIENKMRVGLNMFGRNKLASVANQVFEFIKNHKSGTSWAEVLLQFTNDVAVKELQEILDVLLALDRISFVDHKYRIKVC